MGEFIRPAQGDDLVAAITELGFQKMPIPGAVSRAVDEDKGCQESHLHIAQ